MQKKTETINILKKKNNNKKQYTVFTIYQLQNIFGSFKQK